MKQINIRIKVRSMFESTDWFRKPPIVATTPMDPDDTESMNSYLCGIVANADVPDGIVEVRASVIPFSVDESDEGQLSGILGVTHLTVVKSPGNVIVMPFDPMPLVQAKADILAHPHHFDMLNFVEDPSLLDNEKLTEIGCGTVFCIGGSIVIRHFGAVAHAKSAMTPDRSRLTGLTPDSTVTWEDCLTIATGMSHFEIRNLFYLWGWKYICPNLEELDPTVENAIFVINEFLRQKGYDPQGNSIS